MQRNYDPLIVFSFSKKECELLARQMAELDLNNSSEKKLVEGIFWNAVDILSEEDRRLPQASSVRGLALVRQQLLGIFGSAGHDVRSVGNSSMTGVVTNHLCATTWALERPRGHSRH